MSGPLGVSSLQHIAYEHAGSSLTMGGTTGFEFDRHLDYFDTAGSFSWTRPTPDEGWEIAFYMVQLINGSDGAGRPAKGTAVGGPPGIDGGSIRFQLDPAAVGASETVVVGAGGVGATSTGYGTAGGISSFSASSIRATKGKGILLTAQGPIADESKPGAGGWGGGILVTDVTSSSKSVRNSSDTGSTTVHEVDTITRNATPGTEGSPSANAARGQGGYIAGWWGSGTAGPTQGAVGGLWGDNNEYLSGGGGSGGGSGNPSGNGQNGAHGVAPGGGPGGGGTAQAALLGGGTSGNGGNGAPGAVAIWTVMRRSIADDD